MIPYLECLNPDQSGITLEKYETLSQIRFIQGQTVQLHQHTFYEMVLILRGSCRHFYRENDIPLIPGDLFLIPPHQPHAYHFCDTIAMCNCQFCREILDNESEQFISDIEYTALQKKTPVHKRFQDIQAVWMDSNSRIPLKHVGNINSQGIVHLNRTEQNHIFSLFEQISKEQAEQKFGSERMKRNLLETALIQIKRVQMNQFELMEHSPSWQAEMIDAVLNQIEQDISMEYDFNMIAKKQGISISYFRMIFKRHTGLSPIEYMNRVRMLQALQLLQTTQNSITDIAEQVGIHDPNYFTRIFKKLLGYPPSYFKAIIPEN